VDDEFQIHLKFNEHFDSMIFYTELGEVPHIGKKEILRHYVMQNGSADSNSLTFSFDEESKQIGMACSLPTAFINLDNFKKNPRKIYRTLSKRARRYGVLFTGRTSQR
jgi:hypothetical protein